MSPILHNLASCPRRCNITRACSLKMNALLLPKSKAARKSSFIIWSGMMQRLILRSRSAAFPESTLSHNLPKRRTLIAAPNRRTGPLMERRADRELPEIPSPSKRWLKTIPIFLALMGASSLAIFNYQKTSSSVVNSTLYALRTHPQARVLLGDEIYFRDRIPWIWGELNQLHGRINIGFGVKGTKDTGYMRFHSVRRSRAGYVSLKLETQLHEH